MSLLYRVKKLERGGDRCGHSRLVIFLTDSDSDKPITSASTNDGRWRIFRLATESNEDFKQRIEAEAPPSENGLIAVTLEHKTARGI